MNKAARRGGRLLVMIVVISVGLSCGADQRERPQADAADRTPPKLLLWAWRHGGDFSFLDGAADAEVVQWIGTVRWFERSTVLGTAGKVPIEVEETGATFTLGLQHRAAVVVRLESVVRPGRAIQSGEPSAEQLAQVILALWRAQPTDSVPSTLAAGGTIGRRPELQIDFDALVSQRSLYRRLLHILAQEVDTLSITALASWCWEEDWLDELPIRYAVPMLFRLGPDAAQVRARYLGDPPPPALSCRGSLGLSLDEDLVLPPRSLSRLFLFSAEPWSGEQFTAATARMERP